MTVASSEGAGDRIVFECGTRRLAVSLPRHGVLALNLLLAALVAWSAGTAAYIAFHDTVVSELSAGAKAAGRGYEAQIAALRAELERTRTRALVERAGSEQRVAELLRRQDSIERRQTRLAELAAVGPTDPPAAGLAVSPSRPEPIAPSGRALDSVEDAPLELRSYLQATERVARALDRIETGQVRTLEGIAALTSERRRRLERVYDLAGVAKPGAPRLPARGGPFEPLPRAASAFEARAAEIAAERVVVSSLEKGLARVPIRTPAPGASVSSGFGARIDPFLGRAAFHAGLDFEKEHGAPVRATASGRVVVAGPNGGYGNMVEMDHGGGLTTRFGHMSSVAVQPGDHVASGEVIGRVGSTGRSTGPHLHYETRIAGEAVDPIRFLEAGRTLVAPR